MIYNCNDLSCSQHAADGTPSFVVCVQCGFSFIKWLSLFKMSFNDLAFFILIWKF